MATSNRQSNASKEGIENSAFEINEKPDNANHNDSSTRKASGPEVGGNNGGNIVSKLIVGARSGVYNLVLNNKEVAKNVGAVGLFGAYHAYVATAVAYAARNEEPIAWCDGLGLLIILTVLLNWGLFYYFVIKAFFGKVLYSKCIQPVARVWKRIFSHWWIGLVLLAGVVAFVIIDAWGEWRRLTSAGGIVVLLFVTFLLSTHPGEVKWRQVGGGLGLQFVLGLGALRWEGGRNFLECLSRKITTFLAFSDEGSSFIYNFIASGDIEVSNSTLPLSLKLTYPFHLSIPTSFAFSTLSVIFFFSFVVQLLYHLGVMVWVVSKVGFVLKILVGTSAAESMNAAANIFLGQTEAPLLIKPFIDDLTLSELHAVMTGGFATIAGTVMAAYISFGVKAESILSASVMAAPCALALSKLIYPETEVSKTTDKQIQSVNTKSEGNALDAASKGATEAIGLIWNIIANIIAFVSFVAFLNAVVSWFGTQVGLPQMSFEWLLSKLFIPVAIILGVDPAESEDVAKVLGLKIVANEFLAYGELAKMTWLSVRSRRLAEYALCGFANFSSIGIQLGGLGSIAPKRRGDLAKIVWRALFAGATASLINACVAGTLLSFDEE